MIRPLALALLALPALPAAATATDRGYSVGSFDRVRVDGPFDVRITVGSAPRATVSGEQSLIDRVDISVNGTTLVVRNRRDRWQERPRAATIAGAPLIVVLATPSLANVTVTASARVSVDKMVSPRVDLSIGGSGGITVKGIRADQLVASVIGGGAMTLAGRAGKARLDTNGPGSVDATGLAADDLTVRLDGNGETKAMARYTAAVTNVGVGTVTILGNPKCTVKADAGGPVACGK